MQAFGKILRPALDRLYLLSGGMAALFLILILLLIVSQMVARWTGLVLTGAPDFTGYSMAASSFLALSYALNRGNHIRVSLLLNVLGRFRRYGEIWCFAVGSYLAVFFAYYAIKSTNESWRFNDISQGQDAWPIWIPQTFMCIGTVIFAIAFIDHLIALFLTGNHRIDEETLDANVE